MPKTPPYLDLRDEDEKDVPMMTVGYVTFPRVYETLNAYTNACCADLLESINANELLQIIEYKRDVIKTCLLSGAKPRWSVNDLREKLGINVVL